MAAAARDVAHLMPRPFPIAEQSDGINLLRSKGGASPRALFDLKNGYVTSKKTINAKPGSVNVASAPGTKGGVGFENKIHVFAATPVVVSDPLIVVNVLRHPTGGAAGLLKIHRAFAYLGRLYVVAEFTDGVVQHYWLEAPSAWQANTAMAYGARVQPMTANGYYYELATVNSFPAWQANTEVAIGSVKQPTTANGFKYTVTATTGTAPIRTGNTEPAWPTVDGATVVERRWVTDEQVVPGSDTTSGEGSPIGGAGGGGQMTEYEPFPPTHER